MLKNSLRFSTMLIQQGNRTFIALPESVTMIWGSKSHYYVAGVINGRAFRGCTERIGERHMLPIGKTWLRDNLPVSAEEVTVMLRLEPPQVEDLPDDFAAALRAQPQALEFFESLATFYRKGYVRWIEEAKRPQTRAERVAETVRLLLEGRNQR